MTGITMMALKLQQLIWSYNDVYGVAAMALELQPWPWSYCDGSRAVLFNWGVKPLGGMPIVRGEGEASGELGVIESTSNRFHAF